MARSTLAQLRRSGWQAASKAARQERKKAEKTAKAAEKAANGGAGKARRKRKKFGKTMCALCNCKIHSQRDLDGHLGGKRHRQALLMAKVLQEAATCASMANGPKLDPHHQPAPSASTDREEREAARKAEQKRRRLARTLAEPWLAADALRDGASWLQTDRDVVLAAVKYDAAALRCASAPLRADKEVVLAAVQRSGIALAHAAAALRADTTVVMAAVRQNAAALRHACAALRNDRAVALVAVERDGRALEHTSAAMKKDRAVVLKAVRANGLALEHAHASLKADGALTAVAVAQNPNAAVFGLSCSAAIVVESSDEDGHEDSSRTLLGRAHPTQPPESGTRNRRTNETSVGSVGRCGAERGRPGSGRKAARACVQCTQETRKRCPCCSHPFCSVACQKLHWRAKHAVYDHVGRKDTSRAKSDKHVSDGDDSDGSRPVPAAMSAGHGGRQHAAQQPPQWPRGTHAPRGRCGAERGRQGSGRKAARACVQCTQGTRKRCPCCSHPFCSVACQKLHWRAKKLRHAQAHNLDVYE